MRLVSIEDIYYETVWRGKVESPEGGLFLTARLVNVPVWRGGVCVGEGGEREREWVM